MSKLYDFIPYGAEPCGYYGRISRAKYKQVFVLRLYRRFDCSGFVNFYNFFVFVEFSRKCDAESGQSIHLGCLRILSIFAKLVIFENVRFWPLLSILRVY